MVAIPRRVRRGSILEPPHTAPVIKKNKASPVGYKRTTPIIWQPTALGIADAARSLRVSKRTIEIAVKAKELPAYTPTWGARRKRILTVDLITWVRTYWLKG